MDETYVFGALTIERKRHRVICGGAVVPLAPTELKLLLLLVRHADRIVRSELLVAELWGQHGTPSRSPLRNYVGRLRARLEAAGCLDPIIYNQPHVGYGILRVSTAYPWTNKHPTSSPDAKSPPTTSPAVGTSPSISSTGPTRAC